MNQMAEIVSCIPVPKEAVDLIWGDVRPMLEAASNTSKGRYMVQDVRAGIDAGAYLLWVVVIDDKVVAAITTRIIEYPRCRAMALDWIGGSQMKKWIKAVSEAMASHARHNGCTHMEGYGRSAWIKWIARHGWKEDYVSFRMELRDDKLPVQSV